LSQEILAMLFGVSRTSIHNWLAQYSTRELEQAILASIHCFSGQVSVDEKWIRIAGVWHFCLFAVDAVTGFPLLIRLHPGIDATSWHVFFVQLKALYGTPKLLISDGSKALLNAKQRVFPNVVHQLCKFHKLRHLFQVIHTHVKDAALRKRCLRLAKNVFANRDVSSRKKAARTLASIAGEPVADYVQGHILDGWKKLTRSLTNNAAERFNRKIQRAIAARYGIPNVESAKRVLRALWLKELLMHGKQHRIQTQALDQIQLSKVCQAHLQTNKILHFFSDSVPQDLDLAA